MIDRGEMSAKANSGSRMTDEKPFMNLKDIISYISRTHQKR